jgi:flavin reductase (DIM6/NTAB) family NADH-FMN oxidoreductase RutF
MTPEYQAIVDGFRETMASVCAPVTVITAHGDDGAHGTTVSAFMSLSMNPPMVGLALDRDSTMLEVIRRHRRFGVNVLASDQSRTALAFARKGADKFDGIEWEMTDGLPRILGVSAWLTCYLADLVDGGDHMIVQGAVRSSTTSGREPLTYYARTFGTHVSSALATAS